MGRIALLPDEVASQVAAGEVVERPASIVKELVENSLDAQATRIEVAVVRGGSSAIRVTDNGIGMDRDDALLSLERHATSKIKSGEDLARIQTLGFRGEALPSIASVTRFRLSTRPMGALEGTEILVNGGKMETVRASGEAPGTTIEARALFFNLPARRKFLRGENTESSHVQHQLLLQAIAHSGVGFTFLRNKETVFLVPPTKDLVDRVRDLRGPAFLEQLLPIPADEVHQVRFSGLLGRAGVSRATRVEQLIFVNGRPIENSLVSQGLREGYHTALMKGQFPVTFLFLDMDPAAVDVNVHPAKREVRFREPDRIRDAVARIVQRTLESDRARWSSKFQVGQTPVSSGAIKAHFSTEDNRPLIPPAQQFALRRDWSEFGGAQNRPERDPTEGWPVAQPRIDASEDQGALRNEVGRPAQLTSAGKAETNLFQFRIIGILGKLYILMENGDGLVLVDQHAAHERILFERMRRQMEEGGVPSQRLLIPLTVQVAPHDYDWLLAHMKSLDKMGFNLEPFGQATFKIDSVPQFFRVDDLGSAIRRLIDELKSMTPTTSNVRMGEDVIAKTVCRHAIKANDELRRPEVEQLVIDLLACNLPYCCPHGRPTMIQIPYLELEKKFGRKV
jgi:DNA mismatch repair protein MutL